MLLYKRSIYLSVPRNIINFFACFCTYIFQTDKYHRGRLSTLYVSRLNTKGLLYFLAETHGQSPSCDFNTIKIKKDVPCPSYFFTLFSMGNVKQKPSRHRTTTAVVLAVSFLFSPILGTYAEEIVSVDTPSLNSGYSLYGDITSAETQTTVKYGDGIPNSLHNASTTSCVSQAQNTGNSETFVFATCDFPNLTPPSFTANTNLLTLWQAGNEDIRSDITNKAKFGVYSKLFLALRHSSAYNKGYALYERDNAKLGALNGSYFDSIEQVKKGIPSNYLIAHTGSYKIEALDFLYMTPEIAPKFYYSEDQSNRYKNFEKTTLNVAKKVQAIKNKKTLSKLETAFVKVLKDNKGMMENDKYALFMIIYQIVVEQNESIKG